MLDPDSPLAARLRLHRVQIRAADAGTVVLRNVPANERFFNKARTNLLVKRPHNGMPFLIGVDEDLEYTGPNPALARAFSGGTTQQGWRVVFIDPRVRADLTLVVEDALRAVGFDGVEPAWTAPADRGAEPGGLATRFGIDLSTGEPDASGPPCETGRTEAVAEVVSSLLQWRPRLPLVAGDPGVGKSYLLRAVASRLRACRPGWRVIRIDLGHLFAGTMFEAERENLLGAVIDEIALGDERVLALEHLDLVPAGTRHGALALARALDQGGRIVGTSLPACLAAFEDVPFRRHLHVVHIEPLSPDDTRAVVRASLRELSVHHQVRIDETCVETVVSRARTLAGHLPGTALALIDAACARARLSGMPAVEASVVLRRGVRVHRGRGVPPVTDRLFGLETEYAMVPVGCQRVAVDRDRLIARLAERANDTLPSLPDGTGHGVFLGNGARFYIDCGHHPEMTTPEVANPWDAVRYVLAGERILERLFDGAGSGADGLPSVLLFKGNVDYDTRATWGCHESIMHRVDPALLPAQLIPHLVSRIVFTGAGGFDPLSPGLEFMLSPRAVFLEHEVSGESTSGRGIFHTKNETLCKEGYQRLHILCGESLCSQTAMWLRTATTVLVVALIEGGAEPGSGVELSAPLDALRTVAGDSTCRAALASRAGIDRHGPRDPAPLPGDCRGPPLGGVHAAVDRDGVRAVARDAGSAGTRAGIGGNHARLGHQARSLRAVRRKARLQLDCPGRVDTHPAPRPCAARRGGCPTRAVNDPGSVARADRYGAADQAAIRAAPARSRSFMGSPRGLCQAAKGTARG